MVRFAQFALVASSAFALGVYSTQAAPAVAQDDKPIRAAIQTMEDGWNAGSGVKFASPFADNADYVVVNGMHMKGKQIIASGHDTIFQSIYKGSNNKHEVKSIRFIRPDVALAHTRWTLKVAGDRPAANAYSTMVFVKNGDTWEIASFQNTPVQAAG